MTTRKAPQTVAALWTTGFAALLLLGAWSGSALASSDIPAPCPEPTAQTDASLHYMLDEDATAPTLRTIDASESVASGDVNDEESEAAENATIRNTEMPDIATRLPGVSSSDLPRFRRQMFRTDI